MNVQKSITLFAKAQNLLPGGVDSPARAFRAVGGQPLFIDRGEGAYMQDVDGNRFIDYVLSFGPLIRGHAHPEVVEALAQVAANGTSFGAPSPLEVELAELVMTFMPNIEMVRFVNSGTKATMSALRLARAFTGRSKIIKFQGNYHGHADMLLVQAGSGVATLGLPDSPGVPAATVSDTLVAIGPLTLSSRTWVPAMVPWRSTEDGDATDDVIDWYRRFAEGQPGAIVVHRQLQAAVDNQANAAMPRPSVRYRVLDRLLYDAVGGDLHCCWQGRKGRTRFDGDCGLLVPPGRLL